MASPSRNSLAVVNPVLSNFALEYSQEGLVSQSGSGFGLTPDFIFPKVRHPAAGLTGTYYTLNIANRFNLPAAGIIRRASGSDYHSVDWDVSSATYTIEDYGLGHTWDDNEDAANLGPFALNRKTTEILMDKLLLAYARRINAIAFSASVITQTATAAALNGIWSSAGSNPIADINTGINTVYQATGKRPNRCVMGWDTWITGIMDNDEILARIQAGNNMAGNADITPRLVGERLFNLDLRVDTGIIDTSVEGQTASLSTSGTGMVGKNCLIYYADPAPMNVMSATLGLTISTDEWFRVRTWNVNPKSHRVTVSMMTAEETVAAAFGYLITSAVA